MQNLLEPISRSEKETTSCPLRKSPNVSIIHSFSGLSALLRSKSTWERLLQILPFIIAISYMVIFSAADSYPYAFSSPNDQGLFQRIALNLLKGGNFSGSVAGRAVFCPIRPPLYSFVLALTWKISGGMSLLPIRLIQGCCYLLTLYFISRIGTIVAGGDRRYGLLSALFASVMPFAAAAAHVILTESLTLFLLTTSVFLAVRFGTNRGRASLAALGAILGLLILMRPTFMLIPGLFLLYVLFSLKIRKKEIVAVVLLIMLPLTAVVAPWTLYAKSETGAWSLVRTGVGFNIMQGIVRHNPRLLEKFFQDYRHFQTDASGNREITAGIDTLLRSKEDIPTQAGYFSPRIVKYINYALTTYIAAWQPRPPSARQIIECDRFLRKTAAVWIRHYPFHFSKIISANAENLLFGDFQPLVYQEIKGYLYLYTSVVKWALWLLFIAGTLVLLRQREFQIVFFPLAIVLYLIIVHSPMHTEPRYFIYAYTFMPMTLPALFQGPHERRESAHDKPETHG